MFTLLDAWTGEPVRTDDGLFAVFETQAEANGAALWLGYAGLVVAIAHV